MVGRPIGMGWTNGMGVSVRYATIRTMVVMVHGPWRLRSAMLHGRLSLGLHVDADTDTGRPRAMRFGRRR
jgi:hypothetical protein